jgi:hypothetical protein
MVAFMLIGRGGEGIWFGAVFTSHADVRARNVPPAPKRKNIN